MEIKSKECNCYQLDLITISQSSENNCRCGFTMRGNFTVANIIPRGMCIFAFQAIYPYYLTLKNKGWFSWVKRGEGVIVRCPNPIVAVEMQVFSDEKKDQVLVEIIRVDGHCVKGYKEADSFLLSPETFNFCPNVLAAILPYVYLLENSGKLPWKDEKKGWILRCPDSQCGAVFTVTKKEG